MTKVWAIYKVVPKKIGQMVGIGSVNDVPRERTGQGAAREENAQLRADLTAANTVIAENMTHIMAMVSMFDLMADSNPALAKMWREVPPTINPNHIPEELGELERQTERRSSELRDDLNL